MAALRRDDQFGRPKIDEHTISTFGRSPARRWNADQLLFASPVAPSVPARFRPAAPARPQSTPSAKDADVAPTNRASAIADIRPATRS
jgi:hypothetical protein